MNSGGEHGEKAAAAFLERDSERKTSPEPKRNWPTGAWWQMKLIREYVYLSDLKFAVLAVATTHSTPLYGHFGK